MTTDSHQKMFSCSCHDYQHALYLENVDDEWPLLCVAVINPPLPWRSRLRGTWDVLRGDMHYCNEVLLEKEQLRAFYEHVRELEAQS